MPDAKHKTHHAQRIKNFLVSTVGIKYTSNMAPQILRKVLLGTGKCLLILSFLVVVLKVLSANHELLLKLCDFYIYPFYGGVIVLLILSCIKKFRPVCFKAIALLLCGYVLLLIAAVHSSAKHRFEFHKAQIIDQNLKLIGDALHTYAQKHTGCLPVADQWCDLLMEDNKNLTKENFIHPFIESSLIAFNKNLSNMSIEDISDNVVILFEAQGDWNLSGGKELMMNSNPRRTVVGVLFCDGTYWHAFLKDEISYKDTIESLRWKP